MFPRGYDQEAAMKNFAFLLFIGFGIAASAHADAQEPVYVPSVESCLSIRNASGGGKTFSNVCSSKIFASVFIRTGLAFGGYYNSGHMDDLPPGTGNYLYFACPATAEPEDSDTGERVTFRTASYKCRKTGT
jgi:hypothetical protein